MKSAYAKISTSLKYEKLYCLPNELFTSDIFVASDISTQLTIEYIIRDLSGNIILSDSSIICAKSNETVLVKNLNVNIPLLIYNAFVITLITYENEVIVHENTYLFSQEKEIPFNNMLSSNKGNIQASINGNNAILKNIGKEVCLFVKCMDKSATSPIIMDKLPVIFPGETTTVELFSYKKNISEIDLCYDWLNNN